jgi:hypothetical protein
MKAMSKYFASLIWLGVTVLQDYADRLQSFENIGSLSTIPYICTYFIQAAK